MDSVFQALANAHRRRILDIVQSEPGCSVNFVAEHFEMSRIAGRKHLDVLERAGQLVSDKTGRTRALRFNAAPIQMIYDRWTTEFSRYWASAVTRIKYAVEQNGGESP